MGPVWDNVSLPHTKPHLMNCHTITLMTVLTLADKLMNGYQINQADCLCESIHIILPLHICHGKGNTVTASSPESLLLVWPALFWSSCHTYMTGMSFQVQGFGTCCGYPVKGYNGSTAAQDVAINPVSGGNGVSSSGWLFLQCLNDYCPILATYAPGYGISDWFQQLWKVSMKTQRPQASS